MTRLLRRLAAWFDAMADKAAVHELCPECHGWGSHEYWAGPRGMERVTKVCPRCHGSGKRWHR